MAVVEEGQVCRVQPGLRSRDKVWVDDARSEDREYLDEVSFSMLFIGSEGGADVQSARDGEVGIHVGHGQGGHKRGRSIKCFAESEGLGVRG